MATCDVRLVTSRESAVRDAESPHVLAELRRIGLAAELAAWDDPSVDWASSGITVIRSTWDYPERLAAFLAFAEHAAASSSLWNPAALLRWNAHKGYLVELAGRGLPVLPTECVARGDPRPLDAVLGAHGWRDAVVKPAVGLGAGGALRVSLGDAAGAAHFARLLSQGDALVQPYAAAIEREGELSLVYFGGVFRHAVRKRPAAGDFRVQEHVGGHTTPARAETAELRLAEAVLETLAAPTAYARVDLVLLRGVPHLSELELIEPSLYLDNLAGGAAAFARALADLPRASR